jgi:hypothetical protein
MTRRLAFLIVGTPRSGTTLVQRLASEHPDCSVPPETHFFVHFYPQLVRSGVTFPLGGRALRKCLEDYSKLPTSEGLSLRPDDLLNDHPEAGSRPVSLFAAIVRHLAGPSRRVGEKTPDHLLWWKPLARADDQLQFIWVVRDPRGVVASSLNVPWGMNSPSLLAQRWRLDIGALYKARRALEPDRLSVVRFEDVVHDPEGQRASIWQFLHLPTGIPSRQVDESMLRKPREEWKGLAAGPISETRSAAWQEELPTEVSELVESICRREMNDFGYETQVVKRSRLIRADMLKAVYHRVQRLRKQAWIDRQKL